MIKGEYKITEFTVQKTPRIINYNRELEQWVMDLVRSKENSKAYKNSRCEEQPLP